MKQAQWQCMQSSDHVTQSLWHASAHNVSQGSPVSRGARRAPGAVLCSIGKDLESRLLRKSMCRPESLGGAWRRTWLHTWALSVPCQHRHLQATSHLGVPLKALAAAVSGPVGHSCPALSLQARTQQQRGTFLGWTASTVAAPTAQKPAVKDNAWCTHWWGAVVHPAQSDGRGLR